MQQQPHPPLHLPSQTKQEWDYPGVPIQTSYVWPPMHQHTHSSGSGASVGPSSSGEAGSLRSVDLNGSYPPELVSGMPMANNVNGEELLRALHSQTAFVEGDPSTDGDLELYYYRFVRAFRYLLRYVVFGLTLYPSKSGSTAIR